MIKTSNTKTANINIRVYPEINEQADLTNARWQDPTSLTALNESNQIKSNPAAYKKFKNAAELIADCLEGDDTDMGLFFN